MKRVHLLHAWCLIIILLFSALPAVASMPPGHFYAALEAYKNMPPRLQDVVGKNMNAYLLGAEGHDLTYWAPQAYQVKFFDWIAGYAADPLGAYLARREKPGQFLHDDGHSGELIIKMLDLVTGKSRIYGGYPTTGDDAELAFTLGWISHWITDTYIHTLVERYGGIYATDEGQCRHVQLELAESKHIAVVHGFPAVTASSDRRLFAFLSRALSAVYPQTEAFKGISQSHIVSDELGLRHEIGWDYSPAPFVEMLEYGAAMMTDAMECIRESVEKKSTWPSGLAKFGWWLMLSRTVGEAAYERAMNPIVIELTPEPDLVKIVATISDYGLYGKFCRDWDKVMPQAVNRHAQVFNALDAAFSSFKEGASLPPSLTALFPNFDILSPEHRRAPGAPASSSQSQVPLPQDVTSYYDDTTRGDLYPIKDVYYEFKVGQRKVTGRAELKPIEMKDVKMFADNIYHSLPGYIPTGLGASQVADQTYSIPGFATQGGEIEKSLPWPGEAKIEIPLLPEDPPLEQMELKVSLTDDKPFDHPMEGKNPRFEGVEFVVEKAARDLAVRLPGSVVDAYAGEPYKFTAGVPASRMPGQPMFIWSFNDGSPQLNTPTNQTSHAFSQPGQYYITVFLYDQKSGNRLGGGTTVALVNAASMSKEERQTFGQQQASQEASYRDAIGAFQGGDLEEKFQAYCLANQKQIAQGFKPMDYDAFLKKSMADARDKYRAERGEEMPEAMAQTYEKALQQQIEILKKAYKEPPKNLYKPDKK
jgi:hypothetical protein